MAYRVTQRIISSDDLLYPYFDDLCRKYGIKRRAGVVRGHAAAVVGDTDIGYSAVFDLDRHGGRPFVY